MPVEEILRDKTKKAKEKAAMISKWLTDGSLSTHELLLLAGKLKDIEKATCMEALEFATRKNPNLADDHVLSFVAKALTEKVPRVKWESAKIIGNIAPVFPTKLNKPIANLLLNTKYDGTVVRWATAYALGEILKLKLKYNKDLLPAIEAICGSEQDNGVRKKYLDALKKVKK